MITTPPSEGGEGFVTRRDNSPVGGGRRIRQLTASASAAPTRDTADAVTLLVTTSPIPLNPSTLLLDILLRGLATHLKTDTTNPLRLLILADGCALYDPCLRYDERGRLQKADRHSYKKSRVTLDEHHNYVEFIARLRERYVTAPPPHGLDQPGPQQAAQNHTEAQDIAAIRAALNIEVLYLGEDRNLGFARMVEIAIRDYVKTDYVMVCQHDYVLVQEFPLGKVLRALEEGSVIQHTSKTSSRREGDRDGPSCTVEDGAAVAEKQPRRTSAANPSIHDGNYDVVPVVDGGIGPSIHDVNYVGVDCLTTTKPHAQSATATGLASTNGVLLPSVLHRLTHSDSDGNVDGITPLSFQPLRTWYDKTHVARVSTYRRLFDTIPFQPGEFIEDVCFNKRVETVQQFGTYFLDQGVGPVVYHLSGRKLKERSNSGDMASDRVLPPGFWCPLGKEFLNVFEPAEKPALFKKFTGVCWRCGMKGHSSKQCPEEGAEVSYEEKVVARGSRVAAPSSAQRGGGGERVGGGRSRVGSDSTQGGCGGGVGAGEGGGGGGRSRVGSLLPKQLDDADEGEWPTLGGAVGKNGGA